MSKVNFLSFHTILLKILILYSYTDRWTHWFNWFFSFCTCVIESMERNDGLFKRYITYINDHNYNDHDHTIEIFRHYHPVPLNSSKYFNTCWTKLNFLNSTFSHSLDPSYYYTYNQAMTEGVLNSLLAISGIALNLVVYITLLFFQPWTCIRHESFGWTGINMDQWWNMQCYSIR